MLALSIAMVGQRSATGPFWVLPSTFLTGSAAAGGIALINSISNLSGLVGPSVIGLLKGASGSFTAACCCLGWSRWHCYSRALSTREAVGEGIGLFRPRLQLSRLRLADPDRRCPADPPRSV
jgi:hypothetical protein